MVRFVLHDENAPPLPLSPDMSSQNAELVQKAFALGPEFHTYACALEERGSLDSTFLQQLGDRDRALLFALVPRVHQVALEALFWNAANAEGTILDEQEVIGFTRESSSGNLDSFVVVSHNEQEGLEIASAAPVGYFDEQEGQEQQQQLYLDMDDEELFLDVDGDDDLQVQENESQTDSAKKRRKKKKKKKKSTCLSVDPRDREKIQRLNEWLAKGAQLTRQQAKNSTLLIDAAEVGHVEAVSALLAKPGIRILKEVDILKKYDPAYQKSLKCTAFHLSCIAGRIEVMELLMERPEVQLDGGDTTPLHLACFEGHINVVELLLERGASLNVTQGDGTTPLFVACREGHVDVVSLLVEKGADMDHANTSRTTPLFVAAELGQTKIVSILAAKGANTEKARSDRATPLYISAEMGHDEVVAELLLHGAHKDAIRSDGATPLYASVYNGHPGVAKLLVDAGADRTRTYKGWNLREVARNHGHQKCVAVLIE